MILTTIPTTTHRYAREAEQVGRLGLLAWFQGETLGQLSALEEEVQDWALDSEGTPAPRQSDAEEAVISAEQRFAQERQRWQVVVGELAGRLGITEEEAMAARALGAAGGALAGRAPAAAEGATSQLEEERDQLLGELRRLQLDVGDLGEQLEEEQQRATELEVALDVSRAELEERMQSEAAARALGVAAEREAVDRLALLREEQAGAAALLWEMATGLHSSALAMERMVVAAASGEQELGRLSQQEAVQRAQLERSEAAAAVEVAVAMQQGMMQRLEAVAREAEQRAEQEAVAADQLEAQRQGLAVLEGALAEARASGEAHRGQCARAVQAQALLGVETAELAARMADQEHTSAW